MIYGIRKADTEHCVKVCKRLAGGTVEIENETLFVCPSDYCHRSNEEKGPIGIIPNCGVEIYLRVFTETEEDFNNKFGE